MADQKLVVDGDFSPYVAKAKQARKATKDVADEAGKIGDSVASASLKISILIQGLTRAAQLVGAINEKNLSSSKTAGARAVDFQTAAGSRGIKDAGTALKGLEGRAGQGSLNSVIGLAQALAQSQAGSDRKIDPSTIMKALEAARINGETTFGAGFSELTYGLNRGRSVEDITAESMSKRGGLSESAANELGARSQEERSALFIERKREAAGRIARFKNMQAETNSANGGVLKQLATEVVPDSIRNALTPDVNAVREMTDAAVGIANAQRIYGSRPTLNPNPP
jgi:hypothetical protein